MIFQVKFAWRFYVSSDQQASSKANSKNLSSLSRVSTKESLSLINLAETSIQESRAQLCLY